MNKNMFRKYKCLSLVDYCIIGKVLIFIDFMSTGSTSFNLIIFWLPYTDNYCKLFANLFNALFVTLTILITYSNVPIVNSTIPLIGTYTNYF